MKAPILTVLVACVVSAAQAELSFDAGADLRIRHELMENVPGLPGGGVLSSAVRGGFTQHIRFRPRVWGDVRGTTQAGEFWRFHVRLADEFRWAPEPYKNAHSFPGEVIPDNLFLEAKGLFGKFLDFRLGRQDLYNYCGLDHVFVDGTPGDGSRTVYADMAKVRLHVDEVSTLDFFGLYDFDRSDVRWGTDRSRAATRLSGIDSGAEPEMDDWGYGVIWGSRINPALDYQFFVMQKNTHEYTDAKRREHPWTQRELAGTKLVPHLNEEWSLQFEAMGQVGVNGNHDMLSGWSSYAGVNWKSAGPASVRPFGKIGYHFMSGDDDAASEDGGHSAWDPMWARGVNDSEMFLYGTHYGSAWWSNMHYLKTTGGLDFGREHRLTGSAGPLFAAAQDGLGGGDGLFKGFLWQTRYDFPLRLADKDHGERFEIVGHLLAEFFHPGDYYETAKPGWFLRWQIEVRF